MSTVTRFAPSPTGYLHIGGLRTALFSWLFAKSKGGRFLLRIEDTDKARNSQEALSAILEAFEWTGLDYDGEVVYQSQREDIYKSYINQLLDEGKAYHCYMSQEELDSLREEQTKNGERPRYDGRYRDFKGTPPQGIEPVVRIKAPQEGILVFEDGVKGRIEIAADEVDDFIIARADGSPTYNFVVAIDDATMGLTDVVRGDDHLYNTPKQLVVYDALGLKPPRFYHVAMIHNQEGKKLSKRDGAADVMEYKKMGILPEALLNFLVRLGWSSGDKEVFTLKEMLELFNPKSFSKSASSYNYDKLLWLNSEHMKSMEPSLLIELLDEYGVSLGNDIDKELLIEVTLPRAKTLVELSEQINLIVKAPDGYSSKAVKKAYKEETLELLDYFVELLRESNPISKEQYHELISLVVDKRGVGFGRIALPLRVALVGDTTGGDLDVIMQLVGTNKTIERIVNFKEYLRTEFQEEL